MATFRHMRIENASPAPRRVLEHVNRLLEGHDVSLVGTVAANVMLGVVMSEVPDGDLDKIDAFIDELADALRTGARNQLARDREAGGETLQ
jgi:hypothetical protein